MLHPQHQLNQLFLRQALQISAIHLPMDSGIAPADKGVGNYIGHSGIIVDCEQQLFLCPVECALNTQVGQIPRRIVHAGIFPIDEDHA
jgi:hypothetical protein